MNVTVIGVGKLGLPFALQCASKGMNVIGCDSNAELVRNLNSGISQLINEPGLVEKLRKTLETKNFHASSETADAISKSSVVVVLVPVYVNEFGVPDFTIIDSVTRTIGESLNSGTLVCYETTLPVGTTRNRFTKNLEDISGKVAGQDFFVAFSPERVSSGFIFDGFKKYPKLVGGVNEESTKLAVEFYERALDFEIRSDLPKPNGVWPLANSEAAELAKLAETTYRDVNIGLANQFAIYAETIQADIYEIIAACNTQPYSHIHQPGIAVGGHCIPVYPHMYLQGDKDAQLVEVARAINKRMPEHAVKLVENQLGSLTGKKIVILGLAYRAGVKEDAFSGAWDLVKSISSRGGIPLVHDPLYTSTELENLQLTPFTLGENSDAVILHTSHEVYQTLIPRDLPGAEIFIDGRNSAPNAIKDAIKTIVIGKSL